MYKASLLSLSDTEIKLTQNKTETDINVLQLTKWKEEQLSLKEKLKLVDLLPWQISRLTFDKCISNTDCNHKKDHCLQYIGGVDISFIKNDNVNACASLVVLELPGLEVVYKKVEMIELTAPYIPGFLGFRECPSLLKLFQDLKVEKPNYVPQVIVVDGNGILHPQEFGLACHLGVLAHVPTIGLAKSLHHIDNLDQHEVKRQASEAFTSSLDSDSFLIVGESKKEWGYAYRASPDIQNPVYISCGHLITLETALWVIRQCGSYRIPEPTRQADILSREFIRDRDSKLS